MRVMRVKAMYRINVSKNNKSAIKMVSTSTNNSYNQDVWIDGFYLCRPISPPDYHLPSYAISCLILWSFFVLNFLKSFKFRSEVKNCYAFPNDLFKILSKWLAQIKIPVGTLWMRTLAISYHLLLSKCLNFVSFILLYWEWSAKLIKFCQYW